MPSVILRPADTQDAAALAGLSGELGYPSTEGDLVERLASVLGKDDHLVFVAEQDGKVVGWLHAFVALRIESPAFAEIAGLVVARSARGEGLGQQLVQAASAWARLKGLQKLRVRSNVARKESHDFYTRIGFEPLKTQLVYALNLDAE
ncbi:MAG TPA: GNAT family N-acetyltransferase [Geothrix sp.]|nr:GNAT family N-acetyltransferase [Geothrix sp.]